MGCGLACSHNFVPSMLPKWNQNSYFCFRVGKFWSVAPSSGIGNVEAMATAATMMAKAGTPMTVTGWRWGWQQQRRWQPQWAVVMLLN